MNSTTLTSCHGTRETLVRRGRDGLDRYTALGVTASLAAAGDGRPRRFYATTGIDIREDTGANESGDISLPARSAHLDMIEHFVGSGRSVAALFTML